MVVIVGFEEEMHTDGEISLHIEVHEDSNGVQQEQEWAHILFRRGVFLMPLRYRFSMYKNFHGELQEMEIFLVENQYSWCQGHKKIHEIQYGHPLFKVLILVLMFCYVYKYIAPMQKRSDSITNAPCNSHKTICFLWTYSGLYLNIIA